MIRGDSCVHITASYADACDMLGTIAVRWMHAIFVTGRNAMLRSDRAAALGFNLPRVRNDQCDPDVPLEILRVDALMYENGNFLAKFSMYPGFHNMAFCSLRDGRRHEMGSLAHIEYLPRIESVLMNSEVLICDSREVVSMM